jgi:hypothetical protein
MSNSENDPAPMSLADQLKNQREILGSVKDEIKFLQAKKKVHERLAQEDDERLRSCREVLREAKSEIKRLTCAIKQDDAPPLVDLFSGHNLPPGFYVDNVITNTVTMQTTLRFFGPGVMVELEHCRTDPGESWIMQRARAIAHAIAQIDAGQNPSPPAS